MRGTIDLFLDHETRIELADELPPVMVEAVEYGILTFEQYRSPSWRYDDVVQDFRNHIVVFVRIADYLAVHVSDSGLRRLFTTALGDSSFVGFGQLHKEDPKLLNGAFVRGRSRTLWLSGIHARTSLKSDSKVYTGPDLRDSLDYLDDSSYHLTAARTEVGGDLNRVVGSNPKKSTVWIGPSQNWDEFLADTVATLSHLRDSQADATPVPILAVPGDGGEPVNDALDLGFLPPDQVAEDLFSDLPDEYVEQAQLAANYGFEVVSQDGPNLTAITYREGARIGEILVHFDLSDPERVVAHATGDADAPCWNQDMDRIAAAIEREGSYTVRYGSGHVIARQMLFRNRYRDFPFRGFRWDSFEGTSILREKPSSIERTGQEDSLFCWVQRNWPRIGGEGSQQDGWLLCDDGAGEVADFIHIDSASSTLSLIHVKAAFSDSPGRRLAVAPFEVVCNQAVKNLRYLDAGNLRTRLAARISSLNEAWVWNQGAASDRNSFLEMMSQLNPQYNRRVFIVQPHLREEFVGVGLDGATNASRLLQQLTTTLNAADASCRSLGAELTVIGSR